MVWLSLDLAILGPNSSNITLKCCIVWSVYPVQPSKLLIKTSCLLGLIGVAVVTNVVVVVVVAVVVVVTVVGSTLKKLDDHG